MRLEIVFDPVDRHAEDGSFAIDYVELMLTKSGETFNLDWDESQHWVDKEGHHHLYAKGVYIDEEYGNGKLKTLEGTVVSSIQLYDYSNDIEVFSCNLLSMEIYDDEKTYAFPKEALRLPGQEEMER